MHFLVTCLDVLLEPKEINRNIILKIQIAVLPLSSSSLYSGTATPIAMVDLRIPNTSRTQAQAELVALHLLAC
jgi:hypothetical protein